MIDPAAVTAQEKGREYPFFTIAGTKVLPNAAASETAAPVMPANMTDATMLECARPPLR